MQWRDTPQRYGIVSRLLHWGMAILLLWQFSPMLAWRAFGPSPVSALVSRIAPHHGILGTVILLLTLLRGLWGVFNIRRRRPHDGWGSRLAAGVHLLLYGLMAAVPAVALLRIYAGGNGWTAFGVPVVPATGERIVWLARLGDLAHGRLAWTLLALIAGHALMALVHHFVLRDDTLGRTAPWQRKHRSAPDPRPASPSAKDHPMPRLCPSRHLSVLGAAIAFSTLALAALPAIAAVPATGPERLRQTDQRIAQADTGAAPASGRQAPTLPNGAASINETYGDWIVTCNIADDEKVCVFSQTQGNNQTGQRVFAIELRPPVDGKTEGMLLLPFGLKLDDGVKLKIDEQNLGQGARFSTCIPAGCLVPLSFPTVATDALKKGEKLIVNATRSGGREPPVFNIPLDGFTAAFNRTVELAK